MRTTLTLDDDLAMALQEIARATGRPFKSVVNACLRKGLTATPEARAPIVVRTFNSGPREGIDLTKALDLVADMDDEHFRDVTGKLLGEAAVDDRP